VEYGRIVSDAWRITWRHRFLWWFGPFVTSGSCGGGGSGGGGGGDFEVPEGLRGQMPSDIGRFGDEAARWASANAGLIVLGVLLFLLFILAMIILSCISHGSLIGSVARIANGETVTLGSAWREGRRLAWRYVRLWMLAFVVALLGLAVAGVVALVLFLLGSSGGAGLVLAILLAIVCFLIVLVLVLAFGVAVLYAERAIAVDDMGARRSLARGIALLRVHAGRSALLWLIGLGLGIAVGVALVTVAIVLALPLGGAVVAAYLASGFGGATLGLGLIAVLVFVTALWVLSGIANTFTNAVWTLGYLGLTERYPPR
jgi:hypothetical protein